MKVNGIEVEVCNCCEYCKNLEECGKNDLNMICCQKDFGDDDRECYRDCRNCMDDYRTDIYDYYEECYQSGECYEIVSDGDIPF